MAQQPQFANINGAGTGSIIPTSTAPVTTLAKPTPAPAPTASTLPPAVNQNPNAPASVPSTVTTPSDPTAPSPAAVVAAENQIQQTPQQEQAGELSAEDAAVQESQGIIDAIESQFAGSIHTASSNAAGASVAAGEGGSPMAGEQESNAVEPLLDQENTAVQTELNTIRQQAAVDYENEQTAANTNAQNTISQYQTSQKNLQTSAANLGAQGVTAQSLQQNNPDEYNYLLQSGFNGDAAVMEATMLGASSKNVVNGSSPIMTGTSATYIVQSVGPDGQPTFTTKTLDLSSVLQGGEQVVTYGGNTYAQTTGTDGQITLKPLTPQTPVNAGAYGSYVLNPQTGQYELQTTDPLTGVTTSAPSTSSSPQVSNYITNVASSVGLDPSTPLSTAITQAYGSDGSKGMDAIVNAQIAAEGGSLPGVVNNPGNIKFVGSAGQTDSGVKATDGGTFANYTTPDAGKQAMAAIIQSAASGQTGSYGPNPTLADYLGTYSNTSMSSGASSNTSSDNSASDYGLLANVQGFNPSANKEDALAATYLKNYFSTGTIPTAASLGLSTRTGGSNAGAMSEVAIAANTLYKKATGQDLPNATTLAANLALIQGNNALLNSLKVQEGTISANSDLLQGNITSENINQNAPVINSVIDGIQEMIGNPNVSSYLAQNSTLSNELGSLLALKNASGTTVHDKLISADLISPDSSAQQEAEVVNTLMKEARNSHSGILEANLSLYMQTDPLGMDPANPLNSNMTFTGPDGSSVDFNPGSLTSTEAQALLSNGYSMQ